MIERPYAVADVETSRIKDKEKPKTKFWGFADGGGYETFKTTKQFLRFLKGIPPRTILHHYNFDVIQLLLDGCDTLKILKSHNGRLIKCQIGEHFLLNSYSCFPVKLEKIFNAFGYEKTDLGHLTKRNYEDCVNGLKCFMELDSLFQSLVFVSPLKRGTIAATGFAAAEKFAGQMPKDLRFLEAYRGGRVEVFDTRKIDCSNYDIHSSYPQSFIEAENKETLMRVQVTTRDWHCPLFAADCNDMLLFPNGVFQSYVFESTWQKYIEPYAEKTKIKVLERTKFDFSWIVELRNLVRNIYDKKRVSDGAIELCCKLLLNSLYGRIGLRGETERARILDYRPDGDDITVYPLDTGRFLAFDKIERESRANFPFAAFITDNARGRLFRAFKTTNPYYGDTDSIFTPVRNAVKCGDELGGWGDNGREWFQATNVKDYIFGCTKCHGKKIGTFAKFETGEHKGKCKKCKGKGFLVVRKGGDEQLIWTMKQFAAGKCAEHRVRTRKTKLRKRRVLADGRTEPLTVS